MHSQGPDVRCGYRLGGRLSHLGDVKGGEACNQIAALVRYSVHVQVEDLRPTVHAQPVSNSSTVGIQRRKRPLTSPEDS
eukprot:2252089-Pyramimonas_sp.AAC.1